jgi:hypothetical protein
MIALKIPLPPLPKGVKQKEQKFIHMGGHAELSSKRRDFHYRRWGRCCPINSGGPLKWHDNKTK